MIAVIQRVTEARVAVGRTLPSDSDSASSHIVGQIGPGMLALVAVHRDDTREDIDWLVNKLVSLRIFRNADKHFDLDIREVKGSILLVSNFTVAGATRKGRRPSFDAAAPPELGRKLFDELVAAIRALGIPTETGEFGAAMHVSLVNDGPVTFIVDSQEARTGRNST